MSWNRDHATEVVKSMGPFETILFARVAEAGGRRVPVKELSTTLGLPESIEPKQDFPTLCAYVEKSKDRGISLEMPIHSCGTDDGAWYWMSAEDAGDFFLPALNA